MPLAQSKGRSKAFLPNCRLFKLFPQILYKFKKKIIMFERVALKCIK